MQESATILTWRNYEELYRREAWMKRSMTTFRHLNAMSIEGITFVRIGEFSSPSCLKK